MTEDDTFNALRKQPISVLMPYWDDETVTFNEFYKILSDAGWTWPEFVNRRLETKNYKYEF